MLKIRRPLGRLIFNMGIAIPGKTVFLIETTPCVFTNAYSITYSVQPHLSSPEYPETSLSGRILRATDFVNVFVLAYPEISASVSEQ